MKSLSSVMVALLSSTFLLAPAWAADVNVDVDYLNSLTGSKTSWSDSEGTEVTIGDKTFYYNYTKPTDYEETSTAIGNSITADNVYHKLFTNITGTGNVGAIAATSLSGADINIESDFVNNTATTTSNSSKGGAISAVGNVTIGNISGDFLGNHSESTTGYSLGPAIYLESTSSASAVVNKLSGNFVNNYGYTTGRNYVHGGAIDNHGTINEIDANFIGNYAKAANAYILGGAINNGKYNSGGNIGKLSGTFVGNTAESTTNYAYGGAIHNSGTIQEIENANFINNAAIGAKYIYGGAIYNGSTIGDLSGLFYGNHVEATQQNAAGGAIINFSANNSINSITADFIKNYAEGTTKASGGAIENGTVGKIIGNFYDNHAKGVQSATAGAITAYEFGDIIGNFSGNYAEATEGWARGGAIDGRKIGNIEGDITNNYASGKTWATGGAMNIVESGNIIGNISENYATASDGYAHGGAIHSSSVFAYYKGLGTVQGNITNNYVDAATQALGGAIYYELESRIQNDVVGGWSIYSNNEIDNRIKVSDSSMSGNYAHADSGEAYGGAIYGNFIFEQYLTNGDTPWITDEYEDLTDEEALKKVQDIKSSQAMMLTNTSFIDNHADSDNNRALGGAIYSTMDVNIIANAGKTSLFKGNTANGENNAIYMKYSPFATYDYTQDNALDENEIIYSNLNLSATDKGVVQFDDTIDGEGYNISISGDGTGVVKFNNLVKNVTNFTLGANSITHLGLNSKVYAQNMNANVSAIPSGNAVSSPIITVDVEVDKANNKVNTGQIYVDNDIDGDYRVLVNSLNPDVLDNLDDAIVPFLFAPEDDTTTSSSFSVARVIGSPYLWDGKVNARDETEGSTWYLNLTEEENPDYVPPEPEPTPGKIYAPEVIAGIGLHEAAIEQTRSVVHNVKGKVAAGRELNPCCGIYDYSWDGKELRNIWALAQGESANIEEPVDMEAKIWGLEAGFDIQNDPHNTLGVFASYRNGEYELSGKGKKFRSNLGSEIDIDSYLAGLYYRYDRYLVWAFATIYGGIQQADVKTDDGIAKLDTDGIEFGASIEVGRTIELAHDLTLDPSVGLYYTQVNFDDADDNVGKHYEWDDIKHLEAELGAKLEKQFDNAKVYVKPSVIRTLTKDDSVLIIGLNKANTYSDQTLGRIEVGGRYGFTDALSGYAWANYTFGSSYDAYALGAGMSYAW